MGRRGAGTEEGVEKEHTYYEMFTNNYLLSLGVEDVEEKRVGERLGWEKVREEVGRGCEREMGVGMGCGLWAMWVVGCEVLNVECGVFGVRCGVRGVGVGRGVWTVVCAVFWSDQRRTHV